MIRNLLEILLILLMIGFSNLLRSSVDLQSADGSFGDEVMEYNMCQEIFSEAASGVLFDSGGDLAPYQSFDYCEFTIIPDCADSIFIDLISFETELGFDFLTIYDGTSVAGDILYSNSGTQEPISLVATSGAVHIVFNSDISFNLSGFEIAWSTQTFYTGPLTPVIEASASQELFNIPIEFTNATTGVFLNTTWDFGDGNSASGEQVTHQYEFSGSYVVTMTVEVCDYSFSAEEIITISGTPIMEIFPSQVDVTLACDEETSIPIQISNTADGELTWGLEGIGGRYNNPRILTLTAATSGSTDYDNLLEAIDSYFFDYELIASSSTSASVIATLLENIDVVIFPFPNPNLTPLYANLSSLMSQFASDGGIVIMCGPSENQINNLGLMTTSSIIIYGSGSFNIVDTTSPLMANVSGEFLATPPTRVYTITNSDYVSLINTPSINGIIRSGAGYRNIGQGRVYLFGVNLTSVEPNYQNLIGNMVTSFSVGETESWVQADATSGNVLAGDTQTLMFNVSSEGLEPGSYSKLVKILGNVGPVPSVFVLFNLTVLGQGAFAPIESCINLGSMAVGSGTSTNVILNNIGCDTINISGFNFSQGNFDLDINSSIPPFASTEVSIVGSIESLGDFNSELTIFSNIEPLTLCIESIGIPAEGIVSSSEIVFLDNYSCSNPELGSFIVTNNNSENEIISASTLQASDDVLEIGVLLYSTDNAATLNILNAISDGTIGQVNVSTSNVFDITAMQSLINGKDIVILPEPATAPFNNYYTQLAPLLKQHVENGGKLIICDVNGTNILDQLDLFEYNQMTFITADVPCVIHLDSPYSTGLSSVVLSTPGSLSVMPNVAGVNQVVSYNGSDVVFSKKIFDGEVVYYGFDGILMTNDTRRILHNILSIDGYPNSSNVLISPSEAEIVSGGNQIFEIQLDPDFPGNGQYALPLTIQNNNGFRDTINIEVDVSTAPCPSFVYNIKCSNQVYFKNTTKSSYNSVLWDFGDGSTSNEVNPNHTYLLPGDYEVQLTMCNELGCNSQQVTLQNISSPTILSPSCVPTVAGVSGLNGIRNVTLGAINNTTNYTADGWVDYSCEISAELVLGDVVNFSVEAYDPEYLKIWIDYNNDGNFDDINESAYASQSQQEIHNGMIQIPVVAVLNTPLRMRIATDFFPIISACSTLQRGQAEDYAVVIIEPFMAPTADFTASATTVSMGQLINFVNITIGGATSYQWIFESANTTLSSSLNPSNFYIQPGIYDVILIATNAFGTDTIVKNNFITVNSTVNLCGDLSFTSQESGTLYDSGGPNSNYSNNESCSFLIAPLCAETITLNVNAFSLSSNDFIRVYDGISTDGALLWEDTGSPNVSSITASSGAMYITFTSNSSGSTQGFNLSWTTQSFDNGNVSADFFISDSSPDLLEIVNFTDASGSNAVGWIWDFGDGSTSVVQNPTHAFDSPGIYNVTLIAFSCFQSDTVAYSIQVQSAPNIELSENEINLYLGCDGLEQQSLTLFNLGRGNLNWNIDLVQTEEILQVLMLTNLASSTSVTNIVTSINQIFTNYELTQTESSNITDLINLIPNFDVVILPPGGGSLDSFYGQLDDTFLSYVESGGTIIKCGPNGSGGLNSTGLFSTSGTIGSTNWASLSVNNTDALTSLFPSSLTAINTTFYANILNEDFVTLISLGSSKVAGYRNIGLGRAYHIGYNYSILNSYTSILIGRAVLINNGNPDSPINWDTMLQSSGSIPAGGISNLVLNVDQSNLELGAYSAVYTISSNDPVTPVDTLLVNIFVDSSPCPFFDYTVACEGNVVFTNESSNYDIATWTIDGVGEFTGDILEINIPNSGQYLVTLEVCNSFTCATTSQTIDLFISSPLAATTCEPVFSLVCCLAQLQSIATSSGVNSQSLTTWSEEFYNDFSCSDFFVLQQNVVSFIDLELNDLSFYQVYIDYNNNGSFELTELLTSGFNSIVSSGFVLPSSSLTGVPLRMRVILDDNQSDLTPCGNITGGSIHDFGVFIIENEFLPNANFTEVGDLCSEEKTFSNNSINADSFFWEFGDGNTTTLESPTHLYEEDGIYEVTLTASNDEGISIYSTFVTVQQFEDNILITGAPVENNPIIFNLLDVYDTYLWVFENKETSIEQTPTYSFDDPGQKTVTVTVTINGCEHTFTRQLNIGFVSIEDSWTFTDTVLYPNPTNNFAYLELSNYTGEKPVVDLLDVTGRLIGPCRKISEGEGALKYLIEPSVNGVYLIRISSGDSNKTLRLVVSK
jgi:PKD repeat protein